MLKIRALIKKEKVKNCNRYKIEYLYIAKLKKQKFYKRK